MNPDYLPTLRERFGDDAGTREPDPDAERTDEPDDDRPEIRTATTPREEA